MDLIKLLTFLTQTGTEYGIYTNKECIDEDALKDGAVLSVFVRGNVNFDFDKRGRLVGTSTNSRNSYMRRK